MTRVLLLPCPALLVLESSLSGDCLTALLVCVSPDGNSLGETASSLDFASRAQSIVVDPQMHMEMRDKLRGKQKKVDCQEAGTQVREVPGW